MKNGRGLCSFTTLPKNAGKLHKSLDPMFLSTDRGCGQTPGDPYCTVKNNLQFEEMESGGWIPLIMCTETY